MSVLQAPRIEVSWTATALTTNFGGYEVWRRPAHTPVRPFVKIGLISVPTGYTNATVEA